MKMSIRWLRWVFLALYVLAFVTNLVVWFGSHGTENLLKVLLATAVFIGTQAVFLFGAGTIELCRPIKKRRLLIPVIVAAAMCAVLMGGLALALADFFDEAESEWFTYSFWMILAVSWVAWGSVFYVHCQRVDRYTALKRMTVWILGGSLVELLGSVPSHIIVSRRPGCLVGVWSMLGICAGVCVMLWAFGPGIALLFLRDRRAAERALNAETEAMLADDVAPGVESAPDHNPDARDCA